METSRPAEAEDQVKAAWAAAVSLLTRGGASEAKARATFGKLLSQHRKLTPMDLLTALDATRRSGTQDPLPYLTKTMQRLTDSKVDPALRADWT